MDKLLDAAREALESLASISLSEYESTSSAAEKVRANARRARKAAEGLRSALSRIKEFTFGIDVPGEAPFALTVQEENEAAARRYAQGELNKTYLSRDGTVGALLGVRDS
jgi:hypothetical protein